MSIERRDQSSPCAAGYGRNLQVRAGPSADGREDSRKAVQVRAFQMVRFGALNTRETERIGHKHIIYIGLHRIRPPLRKEILIDFQAKMTVRC